MPDATLVLHEKFSYRSGIVEAGGLGRAGKGDHKHLREAETVYTFTSVEALLADFWRDVEGAE